MAKKKELPFTQAAFNARMSQAIAEFKKELQTELARAEDRARRLRAAQAGTARTTTFWRSPYTIKRHQVEGHWVTRVSIPKAPKKGK